MTLGRSLFVALLALTAPVATAPAARADGPVLPLPRFASLKADRVNIRTGPGERYPIEWVFVRKTMPVEILDQVDNWRLIRDVEGTQGWSHINNLTGRRTAVVRGQISAMRQRGEGTSPLVAQVEPGVIGSVLECRGEWCRLEIQGQKGWLPRADLWGVYPAEDFK